MTHKLRPLSIALLIPFTLLTAYTIYDVGVVHVFQHQLENSGGIQVFTDLAIALVFFLCWMFPDAQKNQRNPWPYVIITLIAGSFGPLLYIALAPKPPET